MEGRRTDRQCCLVTPAVVVWCPVRCPWLLASFSPGQLSLPVPRNSCMSPPLAYLRWASQEEKTPYMVIPYVDGISQQLRRVSATFKIKTFFKPHKTLKNLLVKPKDKLDPMQKPGPIYKMKCKDCPKVYIGESKRMLTVRQKEHEKSIQKLRRGEIDIEASEATAEHSYQEGHTISWARLGRRCVSPVRAMGCCCSTESADGSDAGDVNERTALLSDQQRLTGSGESGAEPPADAAPRPGDARTRGDGETLLDGILHDMAAQVIDVAAVDTPNLEQHDYVERCRQYSGALARLSAPPPPAPAVQDVPPALAQRLLAEPPARADEVRRARQTADRLQEAVRAVQVAPGESLVIPFCQTAAVEL